MVRLSRILGLPRVDRDASSTGSSGSRSRPPGRVRRVWLLAFTGYFLAIAGWASALPVNGTYDEADHVIRAYAVASGQVYANGDAATIPASLVPDHVDCTWKRGNATSADCQDLITEDRLIRTQYTAARYSPIYYLPVGLPLLASPNQTGIVLARLMSALMCGLLLASAMAIAAWLRNRLLVAGLALAATPMVFNLAGAINPNGLEIAAGVSLWAALLALLRGDRVADRLSLGGDPVARRLIALAAVSGALLLTVRQLGPVLLAISALACAALARPGRLKALLRRADTWWLAAPLLGCAALFALVWTLSSRIATPPAVSRPVTMTVSDALWGVWDLRIPFYEKQLIGQFSYGETGLPVWFRALWWAMVAALAVPIALGAGRRHLLVNIALFGGLLGLLVALELHFLPHSGWFSHSRYVMPAGVGLLMIPAFASLPGITGRIAGLVASRYPTAIGWFARLAAALTGVLHVGALALVASRFQAGPHRGVNPLAGAWQPIAGPILPLAATMLGVAVLGWLSWGLAVGAHGARGMLEDSPPGTLRLVREQSRCDAPSTGMATRS